MIQSSTNVLWVTIQEGLSAAMKGTTHLSVCCCFLFCFVFVVFVVVLVVNPQHACTRGLE